MDVCLMVGSQRHTTWARWQRFARAVDDLGFAGLFRADHFVNPVVGPTAELIDTWVSLAWLASHTERIEFGTLVSPLSFHHPAHLARTAITVDDLSDGRLTLGLGAGWHAPEHEMFGFDLLPVPARFRRFEEGLQIITGLLKSDDPVTLDGEYYRVNEAQLLPRPARPGGPPILIGGNGPRRTLPLVAQYADEWNAVNIALEHYIERRAHLDRLLAEQGRDPGTLRYSLMAGLVFGRDDREIAAQLVTNHRGQTRDEVRAQGGLVGSGPEIIDQLGALHDAGIQRVMLVWFDLDDLDRLAAFAQAVL